MGLAVEIDKHSGFCAGVIRAIDTAQKKLEGRKRLYSLGDIVHNDSELERLHALGLVTIGKDDLDRMQDADGELLLIRAHGEPPQTYIKAEEKGFGIVDCTCPVVLKLQQEILRAGQRLGDDGQIVIFGKVGHAEVLGLVGQVDGRAVVVEDIGALETAFAEGRIMPGRSTEIFSQTTKSPAEYDQVCRRLGQLLDGAGLVVHDTICSQVAARHSRLSAFASDHDVIIFVSGKSSSNGKILCELCRSCNPRTYHIDSPGEIRAEWFRDGDRVGICGATSTPKWLLENVQGHIEQIDLI